MSGMTVKVGGVVQGVGTGFSPGHWRADAPTGNPLPEPPKPDRPDAPGTVSERDIRQRDERTAANIAAHEASLTPRRWMPPESRS